MEPTSIDGLVAHCQKGRFTGILRMRAREGIGEVWFLSGVADEVHFGVSTGDEAMERMRKATDATYELVARLPHPGGGFKSRFPSKGSIATATPVTLMRYCEQYALTCTLAVESGDGLVEARYELGELVSVETTADDDGITAMLEAKEGTYEFTLPRVELPAGTPVLPPAPSLMESLPPPESLGFRALLEAQPAVRRPASDEAEVKRKTVEIARQQKSAPAPALEAKPAATTPKPAPATAAKIEPKPAPAKKEEPKPVVAAAPRVEPKRVAAPRPTPKIAPKAVAPEKEKEEAKPPAPAPKTEPIEAEPAKTEPAPAEAKQEEAKPAAAPIVEEEKRDEEPAKPVKRKPARTEPETETAKEAQPPAKRSLTWFVVPLLVAAALVYLFWTHRI